MKTSRRWLKTKKCTFSFSLFIKFLTKLENKETVQVKIILTKNYHKLTL